jgi:hypothetical protein
MRMSGGHRGAVAAVAMTVLAVGAAGLGASPAMAAPPHGPRPFANVYQSTVAQKTSDVSLAVNETFAGQAIKITATGAFDYAHNRGSLKMGINLGSAGVAESLQEVFSNGQVYVQVPAAERSALGGKAWVAVPVASSATGGIGQNPTSALALLEASATGVTKVGSVTIDGVATTEYRGTLNPNKSLANASPVIRNMLHQALSQFSGLSSLPIQVWIDGQNRVRRMKETMTLNPNAGSAIASVGAVRVAMTVDLSNYGVPVSVAIPPPNQVSHQSLAGLGAAPGSGSTTT